MPNPWLTHVKSTMASMRKAGTYKKGDGLKKVIHAAKKTYKKTRRAVHNFIKGHRASKKSRRRGGVDPSGAEGSSSDEEGEYNLPPTPEDTGNTQPASAGRRRSTRRRARR